MGRLPINESPVVKRARPRKLRDMRKIFFTLLLSTVLVATAFIATASAQRRWKEIGKTSAGNSVYVDPSTVKKVNGIITARVRVKFVVPVQTPQGPWKTSQHIAMFNCAKSTVAAKESTYYSDESGSKVVDKKTIQQPGFGPAIGGSMTQVALDYFCKK
jgi:hypothetical protein